VHLGSHFITGATDGRAEVDQDILGTALEFIQKSREASLEDPGGHTTPPGMENPDRPSMRIHHEDRHAIGQGHSQQGSRDV
jgi:hypothetical protein